MKLATKMRKQERKEELLVLVKTEIQQLGLVKAKLRNLLTMDGIANGSRREICGVVHSITDSQQELRKTFLRLGGEMASFKHE